MTTFTSTSPQYHEHANALRQRYFVAYSRVPLHRRRSRVPDYGRVRRTITVDEWLWNVALVMKQKLNAQGGTICTNLSEICDEAIRSWLIADAGIREDWLTHPGLLPEDIKAGVATLEQKREQRGKGPRRVKKPRGIPVEVPPGFRTSEGDAAWFFALQAWCDARNLMLLDVRNGRPIVQHGPKAPPAYLDVLPRYSDWPQRSAFL